MPWPAQRREHLAVRYESTMSARVVIRPARDGDREFVTGLVPSLLEFGSPTWEDAGAHAPGFRDVLARAVSAQDSRAAVFIAEGESGAPLGFISLRVHEGIGGVERCHVADLAVTSSARRMGVGTALMRAAESWARERGMSVLSLDVWSSNEAALCFYRHLGYDPESLCLIKRLG